MSDTFGPNSRYSGLAIRKTSAGDGSDVLFVERRIIPGTERYRALDRIRTDGVIRIDLMAAGAFGDSLLYWRICDANGDADPADATKPVGRLIVIPLPLEVASNGDA